MRFRRAVPAICLTAACLTAVLVTSGGGRADGATHNALSPIVGRSIPGAPRGWTRITRSSYFQAEHGPLGLPSGVTSVATARPVGALDPSVTYYLLSSPQAAQSFYRHPGHDWLLEAALRPLVGGFPLAHSRWSDLEQCIYISGPNPNDAPVGAPASQMSGSGKCAIGSPRSSGLASITQDGSIVIVAHKWGSNDAPIPASVTSAFSPAFRHEVATLARGSVQLLRTPSMEPAAVTTTTTPGVRATGAAQRRSIAQRAYGPKNGMVVRLSISDVSRDGYGGVDFELHLFNRGTVPYDCMSVRAQTITERGATPPVSSFAGRNACLAKEIPPGDQVNIPFHAGIADYAGGPDTATSEVIVLPYGSSGSRAAWSLAGVQTPGS